MIKEVNLEAKEFAASIAPTPRSIHGQIYPEQRYRELRTPQRQQAQRVQV